MRARARLLLVAVVILSGASTSTAQVPGVALPGSSAPGSAVISGPLPGNAIGGEFIPPQFHPGVILPGQGTTVQLPSFRFFAVSTSVLVPDGGRAAWGGIGSSTSAGRGFGPAGGRAIGGGAGAQFIDVHATIHDMRAMDQALLDSASPPRPATGGLVVLGILNQSGALSVTEARALHAAEAEAEQSAARDYLLRGRQAMAAGKPGVAKILLEMAARRAVGEQLKNEVMAELEQLAAPATATKPR